MKSKSEPTSGYRIYGIPLWIVIIVVVVTFLLFRFGGGTQGICGTHIETYTSTVRGCDKLAKCQCLHKALFALGS